MSRPVVVMVTQALRDRVHPIAVVVAKRYTDGVVAHNKFKPRGTQLETVEAGFIAEAAVAERLGLPWNEGRRGVCDVGTDVEVRFSWQRQALPVYDYDKPERRFFFVTPLGPDALAIWGWEYGTEVKRKGTKRPYDDKGGEEWVLHRSLLNDI